MAEIRATPRVSDPTRPRVTDSTSTTGGAPQTGGETTTPELRSSDGAAIRRTPTEGDRRSAPEGTLRAGDLARDATRRQGPRFDASKSATELYEAMHGGVTGWGTDEAKIYRTLEGKTPEQISAIRRSYQDHYKRDLDADLKSEMGGDDLRRAQALMKSDAHGADAARLRQAMNGLGTDEKAIFDTLEGRSCEDVAKLRASYRQQYGRELDADLKSELGGTDLERAQAALRGDDTGADVGRLHAAMDGLGTNEQAIFTTLEGKSATERRAIEDRYQQRYQRSLRGDLKREMSGTDLDRAEALLDGRTADAEAARLEGAMRGLGTDEKAIEGVLQGKSDAERSAITRAYERNYGRSLDSALRSEMSGDDLDRAQSLLKDGRLSEAERLRSAMRGWGTDEAEVRASLEGKSKAEIAQIRTEYQQRYGRSLDRDLESDLSGRDLFDAKMSMRGTPASARESLARMNERHAFERGAGNGIGNFVMDSLSGKGELLDRNHQRANEFHRAAMADGRLDDAERARLSQLTGYVNADVGTYREAKDSAADTAGTVAATAAGVAVVIGTAGTATPLVATALGAAGAGAAARTATTGLIQGRGYGWEDAGADAALGSVDGVATVVGMRAGTAIAQGALRSTATQSLRRAGAEITEQAVAQTSKQVLAGSMRSRIAYASLEGTVDGAIGGALASGGNTALREGTWQDGVGAGLARVGGATALGGTLGAGGGAIGGAVMGRNSTRLADDMLDGVGRRGAAAARTAEDPYDVADIYGARQTVGWSGPPTARPPASATHLGHIQRGADAMDAMPAGFRTQLDDTVNRAFTKTADEIDEMATANRRWGELERELADARRLGRPTEDLVQQIDAVKRQVEVDIPHRIRVRQNADRAAASQMMHQFRESMMARGMSEAEAMGRARQIPLDDTVTNPEQFYRSAADFMRLTGRQLDPRKLRVTQSGARGSATKAGKVDIGRGAPKTVLHELGHIVEYADPALHASAVQWRTARAARMPHGVQAKRLNDLVPGNHYKPHEIGVEDHFVTPYVGKLYSDGTSEVITTGIERFATPDTMMQLYRQDPEQFLFIVGAFSR